MVMDMAGRSHEIDLGRVFACGKELLFTMARAPIMSPSLSFLLPPLVSGIRGALTLVQPRLRTCKPVPRVLPYITDGAKCFQRLLPGQETICLPVHGCV